jgi:hypothetical protein
MGLKARFVDHRDQRFHFATTIACDAVVVLPAGNIQRRKSRAAPEVRHPRSFRPALLHTKVLIMQPAHRPRLLASSALFTVLLSSLAQAQEAPAVAEEKETFPPAWIRVDSDSLKLQVWAGATHSLSDTIGLATDIYLDSGTLGEFDLGPAFTAGPFIVTPMLGFQFDWGLHKAAAIVPQLFVVGGPDPIYLELWIQSYLYTPFDYPTADAPAVNTLYGRFFIDYKLGKYIAVGPQIEPLLALSGEDKSLLSLPIGGNVMLTNYGVGNTLILFLGYEAKSEARDAADGNALVGRFTFVKNF